VRLGSGRLAGQLLAVERSEIHRLQHQWREAAIAGGVSQNAPREGEDQARAFDQQEGLARALFQIADRKQAGIGELGDEELRGWPCPRRLSGALGFSKERSFTYWPRTRIISAEPASPPGWGAGASVMGNPSLFKVWPGAGAPGENGRCGPVARRCCCGKRSPGVTRRVRMTISGGEIRSAQ